MGTRAEKGRDFGNFHELSWLLHCYIVGPRSNNPLALSALSEPVSMAPKPLRACC